MNAPAALLDDADFELASRMIGDYAGIKLSLQKRNMVYNRLLRRLRARGLRSFGDYLAAGAARAAPASAKPSSMR